MCPDVLSGGDKQELKNVIKPAVQSAQAHEKMGGCLWSSMFDTMKAENPTSTILLPCPTETLYWSVKDILKTYKIDQ